MTDGRTFPALFLGALVMTGTQGPEARANVVRNGSFELGSRFNGGPMRQGAESYLTFVRQGDERLWTELDDAEAWWVEGSSRDGVQVTTGDGHSGRRCLLLQPTGPRGISVISAFDRTVEGGAVTLSAWVKTKGTRGGMDLDLLSGWQAGAKREAQVRRSVELPPAAAWRRLSVTAESPAKLQAIVRLRAEAGVVWVDDVQIELGAHPSAFNVRPEERSDGLGPGAGGSSSPMVSFRTPTRPTPTRQQVWPAGSGSSFALRASTATATGPGRPPIREEAASGREAPSSKSSSAKSRCQRSSCSASIRAARATAG